MTWTNGEVLTASRMADLDTQKLVGGDVMFGFNKLKILTSGNTFAVSANLGTINYNNTNGTISLYSQNNNANMSIYEFDRSTPASSPPRIGIFRVSNILYSAQNSTSIIFGFGDTNTNLPALCAGITANINVSGWNFTTKNAGSYTQSSTSPPISGDTYIIYLTSSRSSLIKNSVHNATHTTNIPTSGVGHVIGMGSASSGYLLSLDFMG